MALPSNGFAPPRHFGYVRLELRYARTPRALFTRTRQYQAANYGGKMVVLVPLLAKYQFPRSLKFTYNHIHSKTGRPESQQKVPVSGTQLCLGQVFPDAYVKGET